MQIATIALHDEKLALEEDSCPRDYSAEGYDEIAVSGLSITFRSDSITVYCSLDSDSKSWHMDYKGSYTVWYASE